MKRQVVFAALIGTAALLGAGLAGCQRAAQDDGRIVIGMTVPSLTHPFFVHLRDNVVDEAQQLDVEIIVVDAEDVAAKQMSIVEDFIARRVTSLKRMTVTQVGASTSMKREERPSLEVRSTVLTSKIGPSKTRFRSPLLHTR